MKCQNHWSSFRYGFIWKLKLQYLHIIFVTLLCEQSFSKSLNKSLWKPLVKKLWFKISQHSKNYNPKNIKQFSGCSKSDHAENYFPKILYYISNYISFIVNCVKTGNPWLMNHESWPWVMDHDFCWIFETRRLKFSSLLFLLDRSD